MTQTQPQQLAQYTLQFRKFSELIDQLHPNYRGQAWGIAHRLGLDDAISFCENKVFDSNLMQVCRDSENASSI